MTVTEDFADDLRGLNAVDDDLGRTPQEIGVEATVAAASISGEVHGHRSPCVQLDPLLLALPLPRTLILAAAAAELVEVALPVETPEALHDLLFERSGLTLDQATNVVDLTVDLLAEHLKVFPDQDAGLASSGQAIAHADLELAEAATDEPGRLAVTVRATIAAFDEIADADELAERLGRLGFEETAALVAGSAA